MKPSLKVIVRGTKVTAELTDVLTAGMVGVPVEFQFDKDWGDLRKLGVFEGSGQKKYLDLNLGNELTIPWEVLTEERTLLKVGVEWRKPDGTVVIPTRWANVAVTLPGAQAGNDPALKPTPTVYDQIMQAIDEGRLKGEQGPQGDHSTIVCEAKGESIFVTDAAKAKLQGLKMYGKSTQDGTPTPENPVEIVSAGKDGDIVVTVCGANLLPKLPPSKSAVDVVGTNNEDGSYTFSGTASGVWESAFVDLNLTAGTYTLPKQQNGVDFYVRVFDERGKGVATHFHTFTLDGTEYRTAFFMQVYTGKSTNATVYPMLNAGATALPWEPYKDPQTLTVPTPNGLGDGDYIDFAEGVRVEGGIETPLTEEEMAQYAALHTNYPTTTIINDEGVGMEVSYVADTKNYIDKKFNELAAAIVANA